MHPIVETRNFVSLQWGDNNGGEIDNRIFEYQIQDMLFTGQGREPEPGFAAGGLGGSLFIGIGNVKR